MKKQKNRFWLFVFSLCPGAGHMYMGLMRMGLSFMLGFMLMIMVVAITEVAILSVFPIILYIYSFFHANNIGGLDAEQFAALEDEYLLGFGEWDTSRLKLNKKNRNVAAVVCIVLGVCMLWNVGFGMLRDYVGWDNPVIKAVYYTMRDEVPRTIIAVGVIWFGVSLLRGKKIEFAENDGRDEADSAERPMALIGQKEEEHRPDGHSAEEQKADVQGTDEKMMQESEQGE
ncbi:MAG: hypothetical protein K2K90_17170 [Lachnospiraceae bacterium]|nr:hypothetical protein [Lachnospiraceae bacterium]